MLSNQRLQNPNRLFYLVFFNCCCSFLHGLTSPIRCESVQHVGICGCSGAASRHNQKDIPIIHLVPHASYWQRSREWKRCVAFRLVELFVDHVLLSCPNGVKHPALVLEQRVTKGRACSHSDPHLITSPML